MQISLGFPQSNDIIPRPDAGPAITRCHPYAHDAFTLLEEERARMNTRLKQGMNRMGEKKSDINSHTLLTLGAFQP